MEKEILEKGLNINRRRFLSRLSLGIGSVALGSLLIPDLFSKPDDEAVLTGLAQFAPKAKRIIYLFQNGAPSQLDLFDYKPLLQKMHGEDLPASIRLDDPTRRAAASANRSRAGTLRSIPNL